MAVITEGQRRIETTVRKGDTVVVVSLAASPSWEAGVQHLPNATEGNEGRRPHYPSGYAATAEWIVEPSIEKSNG